jgi:hypothetical protein
MMHHRQRETRISVASHVVPPDFLVYGVLVVD